MAMTTAGAIFILSLIAALVAVYQPFGDYLYRVVSGGDQPSFSWVRKALEPV
ncbi:hypothetical protein AB0I37_15855 [Micromonospora purpureochromogenes]|uniref:hypothetical protein n=1 Tax=Micromonospora purpureochromogenes TaxID=47872 RepID=UPI0033CF45C6